MAKISARKKSYLGYYLGIDTVTDFFHDFLIKVRNADAKSEKAAATNMDSAPINFIQALHALMLIVATQPGKSSKNISKHDFFPYIGTVFLTGVSTFLSVYALLYVNLNIAPLIMSALELHQEAKFYSAFIAYLSSALVFGRMSYLADVFSLALKSKLELRLRAQFNYSDESRERIFSSPEGEALKESKNQILSTGVTSLIGHIPALIKLVLLFSINLAYAVFNLDYTIICLSFVLGVIAQGAQRFLTHKIARAKRRVFDADGASIKSFQVDSKQILETNTSRQANAYFKEASEQLTYARANEKILESKQKMVAYYIKVISELCFYLYFAGSLFRNSISMAQIFLLIPFVQSVADNMSGIVGLGFMMSHAKVQVKKMVNVYNDLNQDTIDIPSLKLELTNTQQVVSTVVLSAIYISMQYLKYAQYLKPLTMVALGLSVSSVLWPSAGISMMYCFIVQSIEYLVFRAVGLEGYKPTEKTASSSSSHEDKTSQFENGALLTGTFKFPEKNIERTYEFSLEVGKSHLVIGKNTTGKTLRFSSILAGMQKHEVSITANNQTSSIDQGVFGKQYSMVITDKFELLPMLKDCSYGEALARSFGVNWNEREGLKSYIHKHLTNMGLGDSLFMFEQTMQSNRPTNIGSKGKRESAVVLTALYTAKKRGMKYICFDEAFSGVHTEEAGKLCDIIISECQSEGITAFIIHHHQDLILENSNNIRKMECMVSPDNEDVSIMSPISEKRISTDVQNVASAEILPTTSVGIIEHWNSPADLQSSNQVLRT